MFIFSAVISLFLMVGCVMPHPVEVIRSPGGVELEVSLNSGPVVDTATLRLFLKNVSGFKAGRTVAVTFPEEELRAYLKNQQKPQEFSIGKTKTLIIDEPRSFIFHVRSAGQGEHSYVLDQNTSLTIDIPYCVLKRIRLIIQVDDIGISVPFPFDERSLVQLDVEKLDHILRVKNPKEADEPI